MTTTAIVLILLLASTVGFLIGYIFGRDNGEEEGRDRQWMDDFFLTLETHKKRDKSRGKNPHR